MSEYGFFSRSIKHFKSKKPALYCGFFIVGILTLSFLIPMFWPYNYLSQDLNKSLLSMFSNGHVFGTDEFGRDLFVRVWEGGRISLEIGFLAALLQTAIGIIYGAVSGIAGGLVDEIMMRFADILYSIPNLIIVILLAAFWGSSEMTLIIALSVVDWIGVARVMRTQTLQLKEKDFVAASRMLGAGRLRIIFRHIIPNSAGTIIVSMILNIPSIIFAEGFLSFVGLGISVPKPSWGGLASDGYKYLTSSPQMVLIPLLLITLTMLALNIVGDILRDILN